LSHISADGFDTIWFVVRVVDRALDRACPRCGARAGIKCRDLQRPKRTAPTHIARGWLDRPCPSCRAWPDEGCRTPTGKPTKPHKSRWRQPRLHGQRYGYAQRSPDDPYAELQCRALSAAGCVRIWTDHEHVVGAGRSERRQLLAYLRRGDVLVVWRLEALADTAAELAELAADLHKRGIELCSESEQLDSSRPGAQMFEAVAAVAAVRGASRRRATDGARRRGGRPALLSDEAHTAIRSARESGTHTIDELAAAHGVSRPTIYRSLKRTSPP